MVDIVLEIHLCPLVIKEGTNNFEGDMFIRINNVYSLWDGLKNIKGRFCPN